MRWIKSFYKSDAEIALDDILAQLKDNKPGFKSGELQYQLRQLESRTTANSYIQKIAETLAKNNTAHAIGLVNLVIDDTTALALGKALGKNSTLGVFILGMISAKGLCAIKHGLIINSSVTVFDVDLGFGEERYEDYIAIVRKLIENLLNKWTKLDYKETSIPGIAADKKVNAIDEKIISELIARLRNDDPHLKSVNLSNKYLSIMLMEKLAQALTKNTSVVSLTLDNCGIDYYGIIFLSAALHRNQTLQYLSIQGENCTQEKWYLALNEALKNNSTIRELKLGIDTSYGNKLEQIKNEFRNKIKANIEFYEIIRKLENNHPNFNHLFFPSKLSSNQIQILCRALENNKTVTTLDLSKHSINTDGFIALSNMLKSNTTLKNLDLQYNLIDKSQITYLKQALEKNRSLCSILFPPDFVDYTKEESTVFDRLEIEERLKSNVHLKETNKANQKLDMIDERKRTVLQNIASADSDENAPLNIAHMKDVKTQASYPSNSPSIIFNSTTTPLSENTINSSIPDAPPLTYPKKENTFPQYIDLKKKDQSSLSQVQTSAYVTAPQEMKELKSPKIPTITESQLVDPAPIKKLSIINTQPPSGQSVNSVNLVIDAKTLEKILQSADVKNSQLTLSNATENKESIEAIQKKLNDITGAMAHLDGEALGVIQGKAQALRTALDEANEHKEAEAERERIESDDYLCDYYYVLRSQILHTWLACQVIHSEMVDNDKKTKLDYLAENIDKFAGRFPGLSLLTGFIKGAASSWSYRKKKEAMQYLARFFLGLIEGDLLIDTLARQLTLSQITTLKTTLINAKSGKFRKALEAFKKAKNWILVNDIDNAIKEFAAKQSSQILESMMTGQIKIPCRKKDLPQLFSLVMGANVIYQSPLKLTTANSQASTGNNHSNRQIFQGNTMTGYNHTLFAETTSTALAANTKAEVADSKAVAAAEEARIAQEKIKALEEKLARTNAKLKNVDELNELLFETSSDGMKKQVNASALDKIDLGFSRLQARDEQRGQAIIHELNILKETVRQLKEELQLAKEKTDSKKSSSQTKWSLGTHT